MLAGRVKKLLNGSIRQSIHYWKLSAACLTNPRVDCLGSFFGGMVENSCREETWVDSCSRGDHDWSSRVRGNDSGIRKD